MSIPTFGLRGGLRFDGGAVGLGRAGQRKPCFTADRLFRCDIGNRKPAAVNRRGRLAGTVACKIAEGKLVLREKEILSEPAGLLLLDRLGPGAQTFQAMSYAGRRAISPVPR